MSDHDAYEDEMGRFFCMSDRDIDRLLAGKAPEGDEALEELAAFLREVKAAHSKSPAESTEARQLAAIMEAAQLLSDKGEPVARPASKATGSESQASGLPKWRRKLVLTQLLSTLWAKAAVASVTAALVSGGLAFAGALPDPLQAAVASAADQVGVSLQNPDADEPGDVDVTDDGNANQRDDDDAKKSDDSNANQRDDDDAEKSDAVSGPPPVVETPQPVAASTPPPANDVDDGDKEDVDDGDKEDVDDGDKEDADDEDADEGDHEDADESDEGEEGSDDD